MGDFFRIPNHYRSISFMLPMGAVPGPTASAGAIVFKGTEPLLPDFPEYFEWMLRAPFRTSYLTLALHFALEMKLPPAAMWLDECVMEQAATSRIQQQYLKHHGRLARLPVPLMIYQFTPEQAWRYQTTVRARLSAAAFKRFEAKVAGGLGVEVYYYPTLPVRPNDLFVAPIKAACGASLNADALDATFNDWIALLADLLHLGYMPYAPWNYGMGACVDSGNACIDGGFNDLLTIVPFDAIPGDHLFWRSLSSSVQMLASSIVSVCAAAADARAGAQSDPSSVGVAYVTERLRARVLSDRCECESLDPRLRRYFAAPSVLDVFAHVHETQRDGSISMQFTGEPPLNAMRPGQAQPPARLGMEATPAAGA